MIYRSLALAIAVTLAFAPAASTKTLSDAAVRTRMIRESTASYPGRCACPYDVARNGSTCGRRSAYSRAGGYAPLCYPSDISKRQVDEYRRANRL